MNVSNLALYHPHMRDIRHRGQPELISFPQWYQFNATYREVRWLSGRKDYCGSK